MEPCILLGESPAKCVFRAVGVPGESAGSIRKEVVLNRKDRRFTSEESSRESVRSQLVRSGGSLQDPLFYSARTLTTSFRSRGPSNSQKKIPCQRPSAKRPSSTNTIWVPPTSTDLMCESELPSLC